MKYPVEEKCDWRNYGVSLRGLVRSWLRTFRLNRSRRESAPSTLSCKTACGRVFPADVVLILTVRNGLPYLGLFFRHYRSLGIARFAVVDDGSTDGTYEYLERQADVDLYTSSVSYAECGNGTEWVDALFDRYGRKRWYVVVDVDELLVIPGAAPNLISTFIEVLESRGRKRAMAPMLDAYPRGGIGQAVMHDKQSYHQVVDLIDGTGYSAIATKRQIRISGGPRERVFGDRVNLTKFPVLFADRKTSYSKGNIHGPLPLWRNYSPPLAALVHLKFTSHSEAEFSEITTGDRGSKSARSYGLITSHSDFGSSMSLAYDGSVPIDSADRLVALGFISDIFS